MGAYELFGRRVGWGLAARFRGSVVAFELELVEASGESLGETASIHEDERRPMLFDELEQAGVHRRPDRAAHRPGRGRTARRFLDDLAECTHVVDRDDDL